ncbi:DUF3267 domain-containing protein [Bacillus sp. V3B]|uniref:DUF3267 domain-containing protein n=1 Tax=Bacillus sp. V3B TaxID=2804915 RepID=UPI00210A1ABB|nr:DUF3267 domain-containing protein [Bacillus sp. V3B]MCQ6273396.1 DUF3267 domain-containing protein [Bacillus sp. V3B]
MHCWKEINLNKHYGTQRVFILSFLTMLFTFILLYVPANYIFEPTSLNDKYILLLMAGLWLMYPVHKIIHYMPLIYLKNKIKKSFVVKYCIFPVMQIQVIEPIAKWLFLLSLIAPFIVINSLLVGAFYLFNQYVHYFIILLAYHIGLCVSDLICAKNVLRAPNQAYIEENEDGFEILVNQSKIPM